MHKGNGTEAGGRAPSWPPVFNICATWLAVEGGHAQLIRWARDKRSDRRGESEAGSGDMCA